MLSEVPFYDIPKSPILLIGFFGILVAIVTLYTVNKAYFNSPFNLDNVRRKERENSFSDLESTADDPMGVGK
jgi:hypothetical protein|tara:strand:- start:361 stop:576 length:216 start_codon:yes stop_codon:yes gene_type:complete